MSVLSLNGGKRTTLLFFALILSFLCGCSQDEFKNKEYKNTLAAYSNRTDKVDPIADLRIYQIMVESFLNGDDSVNYNIGLGPSDHKGDLQGVINALPYIKSLGMNAIWLTPIFEAEKINTYPVPLDATAYYTRDYYKIDRHFGDEKKLEELVNKAHSLGIYIFLDGVFGHFKGDLEDSSPTKKKVTKSNMCILPENLFEKESVLSNPVIRHTLCADYDDDGHTLEYYKEVATYYIKNFKIDGWRLDQAYQVPIEAWRELKKTVENASKQVTYTNEFGNKVNPLGYMVAEIWNTNDIMCQFGYGTKKDPALNSTFDFQGRSAILKTFAATQSGKFTHNAKTLKEYLIDNERTLPDHAYPNLMITNHDTVRLGDIIQRADLNSTYKKRIKLALSFLAIAHSGPITNYYGEEIGQEVKNFDKSHPHSYIYYDGHVARDNGKIDNFTLDEEDIKDLFTKLMKFRASHGALSNGAIEFLFVDDNIFCIKKTFKNDKSFIYAINIDTNNERIIKLDKNVLKGRITDEFSKDSFSLSDTLSIKVQPLDFVLLSSEE